MHVRPCLYAITGALFAGLTLSCVSPPPDEDDLTAEEAVAVNSSSSAVVVFGEAADVANVIAAQDTPGPPSQSLEPGCPTLTLSPAGGTAGNVEVDFDEGCPVPPEGNVTCSGRAAGQFDFVANRLILTFEDLSCESAPSLNGSIDVHYSLSEECLILTGDWDLAISQGDDLTRFIGPATVRFAPESATATISFQGTLLRGGDVWNATLDNLVISLADNPSLIPSGGTVSLDGGFLRRLTVRFNADSPTTGQVEVSLLGLPFFPFNLGSI